MEYTEAKALGLPKYDTGRACIKGHFAERLTSTRTCVVCQRASRKRWHLANPGRHNQHTREWKKRNRAGEYNEAARIRMREYYRKRHGIPAATRPTPANCECCLRVLGTGKKVHLDHDHVTGKFRGWLCNKCNLGLGSLGDCIASIELALAYLKCAAIAA